MPKICYIDKNFRGEALQTIDNANRIIESHMADGFQLTLRQLYYQFVTENFIDNTEKSYKRLAKVISDARLAGLIDWESIIDRTRNLEKNSHWDSPKQIIQAVSKQYQIDKWKMQPIRPEVWIEKDALIGVIEGICTEMDVAYFSCRGYTSQSEMWAAAQRLSAYGEYQEVIILHLGDHDPSGMDMSRDIRDRLALFSDNPIRFERIALNYDQIERYNPPPNPTKITDPRAGAYIEEYGESSWELDSLKPKVLVKLVKDTILGLREEDEWDDAQSMEWDQIKILKKLARQVK